MFCSQCGAMFRNDSPACPECGHPAGSINIGARAAKSAGYGQMVRKLGLWFALFAAFNLAIAAAGVINGYASHKAIVGPFEPWPHAPLLAWTYVGNLAWVLLTVRVSMALVAAAALRVLAPWGRRIGTLAAAVAVTQFPIGLLFGAYALVRLMGPQNAALYDDLTGRPREPRKLQAR